jgi:hypothetical protein
MSTHQDKGLTSKNVRATVTGVDSHGQLFRDAAAVVFLKGKKCIYESPFRPSPDGELMVEIPNGKESWRSNAKLKSVSSVGGQPGTFRVTIELERAHSLVIEAPPEEKPETPAAPTPAQNPPPAAAPQAATKPTASLGAPPAAREADQSDASPAQPDPARSVTRQPTGVPAETAVKPASTTAPAPPPKTMIADIARSVMAAELAQLKRELQATIAAQVESALRKPLETLEAKGEQLSRKQPAITEESVLQLATKAAQTAQREWTESQLQKTIAESVRAAMALDTDQRRREFTTMVLGEIETAMRGPISSRIDAKLEEHARQSPPAAQATIATQVESALRKPLETLEAKVEQLSRKQPAITEESVLQLATKAAQTAQREWTESQLQKTIAESVHVAMTIDMDQRRREFTTMVLGEIETAVRGPISSRIDAKLEEHARQSPPITQATITTQVESALRKPLETLEAKVEQLSRKQPAITEESVLQLATKATQTAQREWVDSQLEKTIAESVRAAMNFEMDQRRREFTVMVLGEIETAVRGPISSRIDAKLEEHARRSPPITEETVRRVAAQVAENVQLEWASTRLQKIADAVRAALTGESTSAKETGATGSPPRR